MFSVSFSFACRRFTLFTRSHLPTLLSNLLLHFMSHQFYKNLPFFSVRFSLVGLFLYNATMQSINRELNNMNEENEESVKAGRYSKEKP